jgi:hypothetical protein
VISSARAGKHFFEICHGFPVLRAMARPGRASGPLALKRRTQSRAIRDVTPPMRAASEREPPSQTSA